MKQDKKAKELLQHLKKTTPVNDAILAYSANRHLFKFREILEAIAGELLLLTKWKEKGHPQGCKWTEKHEEQLAYYERCFEILENSPFNEKIKNLK